MIEATVHPLSVADERKVRRWLEDEAAEIFLRCLRAEVAVLQTQAVAEVEKYAAAVSSGEPLPQGAVTALRKASTLSAAVKLMTERMSENSTLTYTTLEVP
jgi:hypothetical protein